MKMKKILAIPLLLVLAGCFGFQPRPTVTDRMNLIMMDDTLTTDEKMLRLKMIEIELAENERRRARRAQAFEDMGKAFDKLDDQRVIVRPRSYTKPGANIIVSD